MPSTRLLPHRRLFLTPVSSKLSILPFPVTYCSSPHRSICPPKHCPFRSSPLIRMLTENSASSSATTNHGAQEDIAPLPLIPCPRCHHGIIEWYISNTAKNPGRHFYKCQFQGVCDSRLVQICFLLRPLCQFSLFICIQLSVCFVVTDFDPLFGISFVFLDWRLQFLEMGERVRRLPPISVGLCVWRRPSAPSGPAIRRNPSSPSAAPN